MCKCFTETNKLLKERTGFEMQAAIFFNGEPTRPILAVEWSGEGKKPRGARAPNMLPSYCPLCGVKYEKPTPAK